MHVIFGPILVFFLAFAAGPVGFCQTLFVGLLQITAGILAGIVSVFIGTQLKLIKTTIARYVLGAFATCVGSYLAFIVWLPVLVGANGDWVSFGEMISAGISFWLGVLVGGPVQLLIKSATDETPDNQPVLSTAMFSDFEDVDLEEAYQDSFHMRMLAIRSRI